MRKILFITFLALNAVIFSSCNSDEEPEDSFQYINLEFFEQFTLEGSEIIFNLQTIETFPCSNFSLKTTVTSSGNHTDINITNIDVPDICVTSLGPATQQLHLGDFNNVSSQFSVWVNEKRHDFAFETTEKTIKVKPGNRFEGNLFFTFDSLLRIPDNTVWGYVVSSSESSKNEIWNQILDAFYETGAEEMTLNDGNYYFFSVQNQEIYFETVKDQPITFYFRFENPIDELISIYERVIQNYEQSGLQIRIFNTKGERYVI